MQYHLLGKTNAACVGLVGLLSNPDSPTVVQQFQMLGGILIHEPDVPDPNTPPSRSFAVRALNADRTVAKMITPLQVPSTYDSVTNKYYYEVYIGNEGATGENYDLAFDQAYTLQIGLSEDESKNNDFDNDLTVEAEIDIEVVKRLKVELPADFPTDTVGPTVFTQINVRDVKDPLQESTYTRSTESGWSPSIPGPINLSTNRYDMRFTALPTAFQLSDFTLDEGAYPDWTAVVDVYEATALDQNIFRLVQSSSEVSYSAGTWSFNIDTSDVIESNFLLVPRIPVDNGAQLGTGGHYIVDPTGDLTFPGLVVRSIGSRG